MTDLLDDAALSAAGRLAVRVVRELGHEPRTATELAGGNENHVVRVTADSADVVVRFTRDPRRLGDDPFDVEAWCAGAAPRAGIPTPRLVARSRVDGVSVLVVEHVAGAPAAAADLDAWRAVGASAARLPQVDTSDAPDGLFTRFGRDLARAWSAHVRYNVAQLRGDDPLIALGVYGERDRAGLRDVVASLDDDTLTQGLVHGDLCHRNLMAAAGGGYVVVDWGSARTGPTPWTDLERIHRWHVAGDAETPVSAATWDAVLEGAGIARARARETVGALAVLHALDVVRWALERRPDRLAELAAESASTVRRGHVRRSPRSRGGVRPLSS